MADTLNLTVTIENYKDFDSSVTCYYAYAENETQATSGTAKKGSFNIISNSVRLDNTLTKHGKFMYFWCEYSNTKYFCKKDISSFNSTGENNFGIKLESV